MTTKLVPLLQVNMLYKKRTIIKSLQLLMYMYACSLGFWWPQFITCNIVALDQINSTFSYTKSPKLWNAKYRLMKVKSFNHNICSDNSLIVLSMKKCKMFIVNLVPFFVTVWQPSYHNPNSAPKGCLLFCFNRHYHICSCKTLINNSINA